MRRILTVVSAGLLLAACSNHLLKEKVYSEVDLGYWIAGEYPGSFKLSAIL